MDEGSTKVGPVFYIGAVLSVLSASAVSLYTVWLQLKNYRRPDLQRVTIRILLMIPVYGFSTLISLNSRNAAFFIDTIRDMYEAFVIYSFFILLINYLDGEGSILDKLRGRLRMHHLWPFNYIWDPIDMSDSRTFLRIKRGVLQFVILKPILSILIMLLKWVDAYDEGYIAWKSSYLWLSLAYNVSVCTAMYWLVMFYIQCHDDLLPYRPMPKFICVKSIIFLTFWQGLFIAFLAWAGLITDGEKYSKNNLATAYQDCLLCLEMPLFAWMHWYAFPWTDYEDSRLSSRLQVFYAIRDCIGTQDLIWDTTHAFPTLSSFFWDSRRPISLGDDELEPIRGYGRVHRYTSDPDADSIEFEIDPQEEMEYQQSRNLVFGDFHFPVIHDDWRHPPEVQVIINKNASQFYENLNSGSASGSKNPPALTNEQLWALDEEDGLLGASSSSRF